MRKAPLLVILAVIAGCGGSAKPTAQQQARLDASAAYDKVQRFCSGKHIELADVRAMAAVWPQLARLRDRYPADKVIKKFAVNAVTISGRPCDYAIEKARAAAIDGQ